LDDEAVYLVPLGSGRFDLYTEPVAEIEPDADAKERAGFWRRRAHQFHEGWKRTSRAAYAARGSDSGRLARLRDWLVRRVADSIADQRTLWSLRDLTSASLVYPADLSEAAAAAIRDGLLAAARRHHGFWLVANLAGVALTAVLVLLPGPNLIGYYFAFRVIGHFLSWRGARQAMDRVSWRPRGEPILTELGQLASLPRIDRTERVSQIAVHLGLPRLESFFDRAAVAPR
jgi:hypothetical protein